MRRVRREGTEPELVVRRLLHRMGYRFRLHAKELPGCPDVVLRPRRAAIFVHGCFWHGHQCRWERPVKSNAAYWAAKIERNQKRDAASIQALRESGWRTLVVWECELKAPEAVQAELRVFLGPPGRPSP
jgi:DNA mismatch endonuclease (patch repair protein)